MCNQSYALNLHIHDRVTHDKDARHVKDNYHVSLGVATAFPWLDCCLEGRPPCDSVVGCHVGTGIVWLCIRVWGVWVLTLVLHDVRIPQVLSIWVGQSLWPLRLGLWSVLTIVSRLWFNVGSKSY